MSDREQQPTAPDDLLDHEESRRRRQGLVTALLRSTTAPEGEAFALASDGNLLEHLPPAISSLREEQVRPALARLLLVANGHGTPCLPEGEACAREVRLLSADNATTDDFACVAPAIVLCSPHPAKQRTEEGYRTMSLCFDHPHMFAALREHFDHLWEQAQPLAGGVTEGGA
ncbi:MAG: hypothetical protein PHI23_02875 [Candidatus Peribacteraceae bacterium]|nr:hypothetical protein [Candidatus Peribacteraceae bacterium]